MIEALLPWLDILQDILLIDLMRKGQKKEMSFGPAIFESSYDRVIDRSIEIEIYDRYRSIVADAHFPWQRGSTKNEGE